MEGTKHYTKEEKIRILNEFFESGESMEMFQVKRGMGHSTLKRWMIGLGVERPESKREQSEARVISAVKDKLNSLKINLRK